MPEPAAEDEVAIMAVRSDSDFNDDGSQGAGAPAASPTANRTSGPSTPSLSRSGRPKASKRKRRAPLNAIKHGVFSRSPVIGDESEEDFLDHWEGLRASYDPRGHNEELIVHDLAVNRLQRYREERWLSEKLRLQIDGVDHCNKADMDQSRLPDDEAAWQAFDPLDGQLALGYVLTKDPDAEVGFGLLMAYVTAFERVTGQTHPKIWLPQEDELDAQFLPVTVGQLLAQLEAGASKAGMTKLQLVSQMGVEFHRAHLCQVLRSQDDRRNREIQLNDALVLNEADFAAHERRVNHLDKEYERLERRLETAQRARGGALPPPLRLHRSES